MKTLIVGANGQLGRCLQACAPTSVTLVAHDIDTLDITDAVQVAALIAEERPELVINAAAYTAVDKAESDEALAHAINSSAVAHLAAAALAIGARLAHVSTDFVFDGKTSTPYLPDAVPCPINAYGRTKLGGERAAGPEALIVRTAWVYAPSGHNFVRTMLRLMAQQREIRVVSDQIGTPTYAPGLAAAIWSLAEKRIKGIYHYTDSGVASWYDFAVAIREEALAFGLLDAPADVSPITTAEYPTPARRPSYSVLDKTSTIAALGEPMRHWRVQLRKMIEEIKTHG